MKISFFFFFAFVTPPISHKALILYVATMQIFKFHCSKILLQCYGMWVILSAISCYFVNFSSFFLVSMHSFTSVIYVTKCQLQKMLYILYLVILLHASSSMYMTCFVSSGSSSTSLWPAKNLLSNVQSMDSLKNSV